MSSLYEFDKSEIIKAIKKLGPSFEGRVYGKCKVIKLEELSKAYERAHIKTEEACNRYFEELEQLRAVYEDFAKADDKIKIQIAIDNREREKYVESLKKTWEKRLKAEDDISKEIEKLG